MLVLKYYEVLEIVSLLFFYNYKLCVNINFVKFIDKLLRNKKFSDSRQKNILTTGIRYCILRIKIDFFNIVI